jgi:hypothetical protein
MLKLCSRPGAQANIYTGIHTSIHVEPTPNLSTARTGMPTHFLQWCQFQPVFLHDFVKCTTGRGGMKAFHESFILTMFPQVSLGHSGGRGRLYLAQDYEQGCVLSTASFYPQFTSNTRLPIHSEIPPVSVKGHPRQHSAGFPAVALQARPTIQ